MFINPVFGNQESAVLCFCHMQSIKKSNITSFFRTVLKSRGSLWAAPVALMDPSFLMSSSGVSFSSFQLSSCRPSSKISNSVITFLQRYCYSYIIITLLQSIVILAWGKLLQQFKVAWFVQHSAVVLSSGQILVLQNISRDTWKIRVLETLFVCKMNDIFWSLSGQVHHQWLCCFLYHPHHGLSWLWLRRSLSKTKGSQCV